MKRIPQQGDGDMRDKGPLSHATEALVQATKIIRSESHEPIHHAFAAYLWYVITALECLNDILTGDQVEGEDTEALGNCMGAAFEERWAREQLAELGAYLAELESVTRAHNP